MADAIIKPDSGNELVLEDAGSTDRLRITDGGSTILYEDGGAAALTIDTSGNILKPLQPAFQAHPSSNKSNTTIGSGGTVPFETERFDQGSNFSSNVFTAPVTGKYQLNLIVYLLDVTANNGYVEFHIQTSNNIYYQIFDPDSFDATASYWNLTISVLADMDTSDTAEVKLAYSGPTFTVHTETFFSGFLVC